MNKKKSIFTITIYLVILLAVIGVFVFYSVSSNNKNIIRCYVTTQDIKPGTTIDSNVLATSFTQTEVHSSYKDEVEKYGGSLITNSDYMLNKQSAGLIPAGTVLSTSFFQTIKDTNKYPEYTNPQFITMPVKTDTLPADGFTKDEEISVIGYMNMELSNSSEDKTSTNWVGILTNKAKVYSTITDETNTVTNVVLVVEKEVYPKLLLASKSASVYYLKGAISDMSEVEGDIVNAIYQSTGLVSNQVFELNATIIGTDTGNIKKVELPELGNKDTTNHLPILSVPEGFSLNLSWTGSPVQAFVKHYGFNGNKGNYYGAYSYANGEAAKKIIYNQSYAEHSFANNFEDEGYYEIEFYANDGSFIKKTLFAIEKENVKWTLEKNATVLIDSYNENSLISLDGYSLEFKGYKEYFKNIDALKDFYETATFNIADLYNKKNPASQTNSINVLISNGAFVLNEDETIGTIFGEDITSMSIVLPYGDTHVTLPLVYFVNVVKSVKDSSNNDIKIDKKMTSAQYNELRKYIETSSQSEFSNKYTYSQMETILNALNAILVENEAGIGLFSNYGEESASDTNYKYTTISYIVRWFLTGKPLSRETYNSIYNTIYSYNDNTNEWTRNNNVEFKLYINNYDIDIEIVNKTDNIVSSSQETTNVPTTVTAKDGE